MALNKAFLVGRTTRDIEVKYTSKTNTAIATFTLACDTGYGERKKSNYFLMRAFKNSAENLAKYVKKGTKLIVEAEPNTETYTDKEGKKVSNTFFYVLSWDFAESKSSQHPTQQTQTQQPVNQPVQQQAQQTTSQPVSQPQSQASPKPWDVSDDLPFV